MKLKNISIIMLCLLLYGCNVYRKNAINTEKIKETNQLLIPPCLNNYNNDE